MSNPSYLNAYRGQALQRAAAKTHALLASCCLCPRKCKINRLKGQYGYCHTALRARVYTSMAHQGEEPPISGTRGSGTIFFSGCTMACAYCQNFEFSQKATGKEITDEELAARMLDLQEKGCHNINLVTPAHVLPQILSALILAIPQGLRIPLVYNTSGYELPQMIKLLDGIVDIFLADMRYHDASIAAAYSDAPGYPRYNQESIAQMHAQAGIAKFDKLGIMLSGLIIRHLVLPENASGTKGIMEFISRSISKDAYISLMSQYLPCHKAATIKGLSRRITMQEYAQAQEIMDALGLHNGWVQEAHGLASLAGIHIKPDDTA